MTKVIEHANGNIIDFGKVVRIERHFKQEDEGGFRWSVYQLESVHKRRHPIHDDETTEKQVWVKVGEGSEDEARAQAAKLAG